MRRLQPVLLLARDERPQLRVCIQSELDASTHKCFHHLGAVRVGKELKARSWVGRAVDAPRAGHAATAVCCSVPFHGALHDRSSLLQLHLSTKIQATRRS
jgi:hypothetical protein